MRIPQTRQLKGERSPYEALSAAIILNAVKDFRGAARMIRRLRRKMSPKQKPTEAVLVCLEARIAHYERVQEDVARFLLSDGFAKLSGLDGSEMLDRLESEVAER